MFLRKIAFVLVFFLLLIFGKSLCLAGIGAFAKGVFHFRKGWDFQYQSVQWTRKGVAFIRPTLRDPGRFFCSAHKMSLALRGRHIEIDAPHLVLWQMPEISGENRFSYCIHDGVIEGQGNLRGRIEGDLYFSDKKFTGSIVAQGVSYEGFCQDLNGQLDWNSWSDWSIDGSLILQGQKIEGKGSSQGFTLQYPGGFLTAQEEKNSWRVVFEALTPKLISSLQVLYPEIQMFQEGTLRGRVVFRSRSDWTVHHLEGQDLLVHHDVGMLRCKNFRIQESACTFRGASFSWEKISGSSWQGDIDALGGHFSGNIGAHAVSIAAEGTVAAFQAQIALQGDVAGEALCVGGWDGGRLHFSLQQGALSTPFGIDQIAMEGEIDRDGFALRDIKGKILSEKPLSFFCPIIQSDGMFDLRLNGELWDLARFVGTREGGLDTARSHILGSPVALQSNHLRFSLPWEKLSLLFQMPKPLEPVHGAIACDVSYAQERGLSLAFAGEDLRWDTEEMPLQCLVHQEGDHWRLEPSQIHGFYFEGNLEWDSPGIVFTKGQGRWENGLTTHLQGRFDSFDRWRVHLSSLCADLAPFFSGVEGTLEGEGHIHSEQEMHADFDLTTSGLRKGDFSLENKESLHLHFSWAQGLAVRGLNPLIFYQGKSWANCKIELLQFHVAKDLWTLTEAGLHASPACLASLQEKAPFLNLNNGLDLTADIECASDFSTFSCLIQEARLPLQDEIIQVRNCHIDATKALCSADFDLQYKEKWIPLHMDFQNKTGRLIVQDTLRLDCVYQDRWVIQAIEGSFAGVEGSFHWEGDSLIGSARIDCQALTEFVPSRLSELFSDLKMGKGYELMGRLNIREQGLSFKGILSGKRVELFGFQLKTLLSQIEWSPDHVLVKDLRISDLSGVMTVDQILAKGIGDAPWTLHVPHIAIAELRPSLLHDVDKGPGHISPLVVRHCTLRNLQGLLDDRSTYTAEGDLSFINSYKREDSILDIPLNVFSRIIGLDLDLLIPVRGSLTYHLQGGRVHLDELQDAYSENGRSEFFLVHNGDSPTMDLDWNLNILIKMKQHVLFKITEYFIISINGQLDDPEFHLKNKKRFLDF